MEKLLIEGGFRVTVHDKAGKVIPVQEVPIIDFTVPVPDIFRKEILFSVDLFQKDFRPAIDVRVEPEILRVAAGVEVTVDIRSIRDAVVLQLLKQRGHGFELTWFFFLALYGSGAEHDHKQRKKQHSTFDTILELFAAAARGAGGHVNKKAGEHTFSVYTPGIKGRICALSAQLWNADLTVRWQGSWVLRGFCTSFCGTAPESSRSPYGTP